MSFRRPFLAALALIAAFVLFASTAHAERGYLGVSVGDDTGGGYRQWADTYGAPPGTPIQQNVATDTLAGHMNVSYFQVSGQATTTRVRGTHDVRVWGSTVPFVPADSMGVIGVIDIDTRNSVGVAGLRRWWDTSGQLVTDSNGLTDSNLNLTNFRRTNIPIIRPDVSDSGSFLLRLINTSNYGCTTTLQFFGAYQGLATNFHGLGATVNSAGGSAFNTDSFTLDLEVGLGGYFSVAAQGLTATNVGNDSYIDMGRGATARGFPGIVLGGVGFAEGAETFITVTVNTDTFAKNRDTLPIHIIIHADSQTGVQANPTADSLNNIPIYTHKNNQAYRGDNGAYYAEGGRYDSVALYAVVQTAVVRVTKRVTTYAPQSWVDLGGGIHDTIPGSTMEWTIVYDNDGDRRADSLMIIEWIPRETVMSGTWTQHPGAGDTPALGMGIIDTRLVHLRGVVRDMAAPAEGQYASSTVIRIYDTANVWGVRGDTNLGEVATDTDYGLNSVVAFRVEFLGGQASPSAGGAALAPAQFNFSVTTQDGTAGIDDDTSADAWAFMSAGSPFAGDSDDAGLIRFRVVVR